MLGKMSRENSSKNLEKWVLSHWIDDQAENIVFRQIVMMADSAGCLEVSFDDIKKNIHKDISYKYWSIKQVFHILHHFFLSLD